MNMLHRHAAGTCITWTLNMVIKQGHAGLTLSMDTQQGHAACTLGWVDIGTGTKIRRGKVALYKLKFLKIVSDIFIEYFYANLPFCLSKRMGAEMLLNVVFVK
jgi:hypothetical protein